MWARISDGVVAELIEDDPLGRFHESIQWAECGEGVGVGWLYDGDQFSAPAPDEGIHPSACTPAQGLVALFALKQITEDHVLEAIAQIPDPVQEYTARIGYQRATAWERNSPTMQTMAQLLQLSEEDLDALYSYAVTVQV